MKSEISSSQVCPCGMPITRGPLCGPCYFASPGHLRHVFEFGNPKRRAHAASALVTLARDRLQRRYTHLVTDLC